MAFCLDVWLHTENQNLKGLGHQATVMAPMTITVQFSTLVCHATNTAAGVLKSFVFFSSRTFDQFGL